MISGRNIFIAGGGTGGHINAALTLGEKLQGNGNQVLYLTGKRHLDYSLYKGQNVLHLDSFPLKTKNPLTLIKNVIKNLLVFIKVFILVLKKKPALMFGAGGYVCGPTLLAGFICRVPVFVLEQNSVMGLTNKILGFIAKRIFVSFEHTKGLAGFLSSKVVLSGNPIRNKFYEVDFHSSPSGKFSILVFGGSLGAMDINNLMKSFLKMDFDMDMDIIHQVGKNNNFKLSDSEISPKINYVQKEYLHDICEEYKKCDFIICRSGASSISELRIVRKPVLLIPLTIHKDKHQVHNAIELKENSDFNVYVHQPSELLENSGDLLKSIMMKELGAKGREVSSVSGSYSRPSVDRIVEELELLVK